MGRSAMGLDQVGIGGYASTPIIEVLASADVLYPVNRHLRVTGNITINTINLPIDFFVGPLYIFNTDATVGTLGTGGNIALGVTLTRYKVFTLIYDPATAKWYPSATS